MSWSDLPAVDGPLREALESFDWPRAATLVTELATRVRTEADPLPTAYLKRLLRRLRRKRRFLEIQQLADALAASGQDSALLRRHLAQSLIDSNLLTRAQEILHTIVEDAGQRAEALGLLGRIEKQHYVAEALGGGRGDPAHLERGLQLYLSVYREDPTEHFWHGINAVALAARALRDGIVLADAPSPTALAQDVLAGIRAAEENSDDDLPAWSVATALEAEVALGHVEQAEQRALDYAGCCDADAFEVFSTLRQLREVWLLEDEDGHRMGRRILPILQAALLRRQGGGIRIQPQDTTRQLEKTFGGDRFQTLSWYQEGLSRCRGVARMERIDGAGFGTGWLVDSREFFPAHAGRLLVLTNAHVVCPDDFQDALNPADALAAFQVLDVRIPVRNAFWCSKELDACFLELERAPDAEPLPLYTRRVHMAKPPSRVYIIGHPGGRDIEFSLQDSHLVDCNERLLHYRTPTDYGSSGSPVFEALGWRVAALHHAGSHAVPSLSEPGATYAANEGIAIACLRDATAAAPPR